MTLEQAKSLKSGQILSHATLKNADGTPMRAKVNGQVKTWKTRPLAVRIPAKRGLYETFQIGQGETDKWCHSEIVEWNL